MSILQKLTQPGAAFSIEFFPPKKDMPVTSVFEAISRLAAYDPAFVSVTYGAGGSNQGRVVDVTSYIKNTLGLEAIAHLTCVGANTESISAILSELESHGINNVLALRGDIPAGMDKVGAFSQYRHASDLIADIKKRGGFSVAAAAYPEAHYESESLDLDISYLLLKQQLGADFFITQLCFDKYALVRFYEKLYKAGVTAPVLTGIMPVLDPKQITRMALLSACSIPAALSKLICLYGEDLAAFSKAGLEYAMDEINFLKSNGINKFHIYTMNKAETAEQILLGSGLAKSI